MPRATLRDVVIILPGIMGSVLTRRGAEVWNLSGRAFARAAASLGDSLWSLAIAHDDADADDLDGVRATALLAGAHLVPGFIGVDGYADLQSLVRQRFTCRPGIVDADGLPVSGNVFDFPYDWRRDCRVAARGLDRFATRALDRWRADTGNPRAQHGRPGQPVLPRRAWRVGPVPGARDVRHAPSGITPGARSARERPAGGSVDRAPRVDGDVDAPSVVHLGLPVAAAVPVSPDGRCVAVPA
jgi:hypothetical protein